MNPSKSCYVGEPKKRRKAPKYKTLILQFTRLNPVKAPAGSVAGGAGMQRVSTRQSLFTPVCWLQSRRCRCPGSLSDSVCGRRVCVGRSSALTNASQPIYIHSRGCEKKPINGHSAAITGARKCKWTLFFFPMTFIWRTEWQSACLSPEEYHHVCLTL